MKVILQNIPEIVDLKTWTTISLPQSADNSKGYITTDAGDQYNAQIIDDVLYVEASLEKGQVLEGFYEAIDSPTINDPFVFSNWVIDDLSSLIPTFRATVGNAGYNSLPTPFVPASDTTTDTWTKLASENHLRKRFTFATKIPIVNLMIAGHFDIFTNQDIVPFYIEVSYPNKQVLHLQHLHMEIGEEGIVDGAKLNKLETNYLGNSRWMISLWQNQILPCPPMVISGALLCRGGKASTLEDRARLLNLANRKEGRIVGKIK